MMIPLIFVLLAISFIAEIIYSIIFFQLYLQRKQAIYRYFTIFTGVAIFWSTGTALMLFANKSSVIFLGYWMFLIAPMLSTLFILFFCQQFILSKRRQIFVLPVVGLIVYAIVLALSDSLISITISQTGLNVIAPNKIFYIFYGLYFTIYFQLSINTLRKHSERKDPLKYSQAQNLVYGTGLTGTPGIITNIVLPAIGITQTVWMGPIFSLVFLSFSTIAITRYKLFDIKGTILRSTSYLFAIALLAVLYALIFVGGLGNTFLKGSTISGYGWISLSAITIFIAVSFNPLKRYFDRITNRFFYQDAYVTKEVLDEVSSVIVGTVDPHKVQKGSLTALANALKPSYASILFLQGTSGLSRGDVIGQHWDMHDPVSLFKVLKTHGKKITTVDELEQKRQATRAVLSLEDISVVAPLVTKDEAIGYLILGSKKSGNIYNPQDIGLLNLVSNELAVALQNAQRFEEIQAFNLTLQEKVTEATRELKSTNKKLVALDEAKDEFISMASHQLRTPLTSIKGYLSMMVEGDLGEVSPAQEKALKEAFGSSQRMVYLIADFLNVSRIRTGKFMIETKEVDLPQIVTEEITQLREMADSRDLTLIYDQPGIFPRVKLDDNKIRQVMMNMVDNAIYYTPSGGSITIQLYSTGEEVIFKVVDDGIGVPKAEQHKLFTKFYRAGNARKSRPDGTGLGLFMAQKIVVEQGGAIIFESTEGKGSTFGFRFPLSKIKA